MQESIVFLLRVQCRRKESARSLSHLLMSFLYTDSSASDTCATKLETDSVWIFLETVSL